MIEQVIDQIQFRELAEVGKVFLSFLGAAAIAVPSLDYLTKRIVFREHYRVNKAIEAGKPPFEDNQLYFSFMKDFYPTPI